MRLQKVVALILYTVVMQVLSVQMAADTHLQAQIHKIHSTPSHGHVGCAVCTQSHKSPWHCRLCCLAGKDGPQPSNRYQWWLVSRSTAGVPGVAAIGPQKTTARVLSNLPAACTYSLPFTAYTGWMMTGKYTLYFLLLAYSSSTVSTDVSTIPGG